MNIKTVVVPKGLKQDVSIVTVLVDKVKALYKSHKRWKEADQLGWALSAKLFIERDPKRCKFLVRNCNRLYRLTRGSGNPWKD